MPVTEEQLKQFLPHNLSAAEVHPETLKINENIVIATLRGGGFPVDDWVEYPELIAGIIAMRSVGDYYATLSSEENESGTNYGTRLVNQADRLLNRILDGSLVLEDQDFITTVGPEIQDSHEPFATIGEVF